MIKLSFFVSLLTALITTSACSAFVAAPKTTMIRQHDVSTTRLYLADLPRNSFQNNEPSNDAASLLNNNGDDLQSLAATVAALGLTALAGGAALDNSDLLLDAIPQLTAQLSQWEQSLQQIVISEPQHAISDALLTYDLPHRLELLQSMVAWNTAVLQNAVTQHTSELSSAASHVLAQLGQVTSSLLQRIEALEFAIQTQVAQWQSVPSDAMHHLQALQTSFRDAKDALVAFQQESLLPVLQATQMKFPLAAALLDDSSVISSRVQEWHDAVAQHLEQSDWAVAAWQASLQLKWSQLQESLIPHSMETARALAAEAVAAARTTQQAVVEQFMHSEQHAGVVAQFHDLQDSLLDQHVVDASSGILVATNALAAAKASADLSLESLEEWLPGYTATVTAIVTASWANSNTNVVVAPQAQQAVAQELLFQLKSALNAQLDALLLHKNTVDREHARQVHHQMATAVAQLQALQAAGGAGNTTHGALKLLTESTSAKLAAVALMLGLEMTASSSTSATVVVEPTGDWRQYAY